MKSHYNVLFLCTGNSSRSIMAEAILNSKGKSMFSAYSAGSRPSGTVRPEALRQLDRAQIPVEGLHSKSWAEFSDPGAPELDFVITVCDNAANEACPVWPGRPATALQEIERAFRDAFFLLDRRIDVFLALQFAALNEPVLKKELARIGESRWVQRNE